MSILSSITSCGVPNTESRSCREHGSAQGTGFWPYAKRLIEDLAGETAGAVTEFGQANGADVSVF